MTIAQTEGVGPAEQKRFVEIFRQAVAWPPVMACYGLDALDSLPGMLKYWLLSHLQYDGAPLALLAEWLRLLDFDVQIKSAGNLDEDAFRADVAECFPSLDRGDPWPRNYILVNYSRSVVGQRMFSGGHYAPIGAFHQEEDKVLLLEVNSWRYPSVWVDLPLLWQATHTQVGNGTWRGYLRISSSNVHRTGKTERWC
ncbi:unnamed protein product [Cladocopium goreaui]|uniref:glutathione gamma-glutamylcysteinyltransferase n=1 Tax=Cladocopium goreaui TaxID=2562237 RepID=A0A9P1D1T2_9DINO|nr:unnamed protein product [Cladocopium goreaui]